ncbi:hypothetical protein DFS34DRAFT_697371 [Phlyctochytrium arcticum]|nr:hypothetical protein DFS34DRAFT_697371 [Phlyctochytrium arcticum]
MEELYDALEKIVFVLSTEDEEEYFTRSVDPTADVRYLELIKTPMDFKTMEQKVSDRTYGTLREVQDDFDLMMRNALMVYPVGSKIYRAAQILWKFGTRVINSQYARFPRNLTIGPEESPTPTPQVKPKPTEVKERNLRAANYTLSQRGPDGTFFFSSLQAKPLEEVPLVEDVMRVAVIPSYSENQEKVPQLKTTIQPPNIHARRLYKPILRRNEPTPVEFMDYGLYYTFAPTSDSSMATLSQAESVQCLKPGREVVLEPGEDNDESDLPPLPEGIKICNGSIPDGDDAVDINTMSPPPAQIDSPSPDPETARAFREVGIDLDTVLSVPKLLREKAGSENDKMQDQEYNSSSTNFGEKRDIETMALDEILDVNADLLADLVECQAWRFQQNLSEVPEFELDIARTLSENLRHLSSRVAPGEVLPAELIEKYMSTLRLYEPAFKGTLPPRKQYTYPSNLGGKTALPTNAGAIPPNSTTGDYVPPRLPSSIPNSGRTSISYSTPMRAPTNTTYANTPIVNGGSPAVGSMSMGASASMYQSPAAGLSSGYAPMNTAGMATRSGTPLTAGNISNNPYLQNLKYGGMTQQSSNSPVAYQMNPSPAISMTGGGLVGTSPALNHMSQVTTPYHHIPQTTNPYAMQTMYGSNTPQTMSLAAPQQLSNQYMSPSSALRAPYTSMTGLSSPNMAAGIVPAGASTYQTHAFSASQQPPTPQQPQHMHISQNMPVPQQTMAAHVIPGQMPYRQQPHPGMMHTPMKPGGGTWPPYQ